MRSELSQGRPAIPPRQPPKWEAVGFAIVVVACILNVLAVPMSSWHYDVFGRLGLTWLGFGAAILVWQIATRRFDWWLVLFTLAISMFASYLNFDMLGRITASI